MCALVTGVQTGALPFSTGDALPDPHRTFAAYVAVGGLAQIAATALLVHLFSFRNFTVGTTYSKTETIQTALFGAVIIGDTISVQATVAILISLAGVFALSVARTELTARRPQNGRASGRERVCQ